MSTQETSNLIHKKAHTARADYDARAMSPSKALRLSLERACDRLLGLALTVCTVEQRRLTLDALRQEAGDDCLILLLEGRGTHPGVALLDRQMVQALVEVQTMRRLRAGAAPDRPFTDTDAAITAPLVDAVIAGFDERLAEEDETRKTSAFRCGDRIADARGLMLVLEDPSHEMFRLTCELGRGEVTGVLTVILPQGAVAPPEPAAGAGTSGGRFELSALVMTAPMTLNAVLDRLSLPLSQVMQFVPGMTLPVDAAAIGRTELVAARGHVAAVARLGQMNGFRAVRLTSAPEGGALPGPPEALEGDSAPDASAAAPQTAAAAAPGPPMPDRQDIPDLPDPPEVPDTYYSAEPAAEPPPDLPGMPALDDAG